MNWSNQLDHLSDAGLNPTYAPTNLISDKVVVLYLSSATKLVNYKATVDDVKVVTYDFPDPVPQGNSPSDSGILSGFIGGAPFSNTPKAVAMIMNPEITLSDKGQPRYTRPSFGYVLLYDTMAATAVVKILKISLTANTFIGRFDLGRPCVDIAGKGNLIQCTDAMGITVFSLVEGSPSTLTQLSTFTNTNLALSGACIATKDELLSYDATSQKIIYFSSTGEEKASQGTFTSLVQFPVTSGGLLTTQEGCLAMTMAGSTQTTVFYYQEQYRTYFKNRFYSQPSVPAGYSSLDDITVLDGQIYHYQTDTLRLVTSVQPDRINLQHKVTQAISVRHYNYSITRPKMNPAHRMVVLFPHMATKTANLILAEVSPSNIEYSPLTPTPLKLTCTLDPFPAGKSYVDYVYKIGSYRNPTYGDETEFFAIINQGTRFGAAEKEVIDRAKVMLIASGAIAVVLILIAFVTTNKGKVKVSGKELKAV